jgi:hypothetical protein
MVLGHQFDVLIMDNGDGGRDYRSSWSDLKGTASCDHVTFRAPGDQTNTTVNIISGNLEYNKMTLNNSRKSAETDVMTAGRKVCVQCLCAVRLIACSTDFGALYLGRIFTITTFKINTCYDTIKSVIKTFRAVTVNC